MSSTIEVESTPQQEQEQQEHEEEDLRSELDKRRSEIKGLLKEKEKKSSRLKEQLRAACIRCEEVISQLSPTNSTTSISISSSSIPTLIKSASTSTAPIDITATPNPSTPSSSLSSSAPDVPSPRYAPDSPEALLSEWKMLHGDCLLNLHKRFKEPTLNLASDKYSDVGSCLLPRSFSSIIKVAPSNNFSYFFGSFTPTPSTPPKSTNPLSCTLPPSLQYKLLRNWAVALALTCTLGATLTPMEETLRSTRLTQSNEIFAASLALTPAATRPNSRARTYYEWGCTLRRISHSFERQNKLVDAYRCLRKAGSMLQKAIELRGHTYTAPLIKWGHLLDDIVSLSQRIPSNSNSNNNTNALTPEELDIKADLDNFLVFFSNRAMRDGGLTLKPLIALCLCPNKQVQRSSLELLRHLCTFADDLEQEKEQWEKDRVHEVLGPYGSEVMAEAQKTLAWIEQIVLSNNALTTAVKIQAMRNIDDLARKFWKASGITYQQAIDNFEVFMNCMSFHVHKPVTTLNQRFFRVPSPAPTASESVPPASTAAPTSRPKSDSFALSNFPGLDALIGDEAARKRSSSQASKFKPDELFKNEDPHKYYKDLEKIGKGGFGDVFIARQKTSRKRVAIKVLRKNANIESNLTQMMKEIVFMRSSAHHNIVSYIESFRWNDQVWLVMDYCDGGTLKALYNKVVINEKHVALIAAEILSGLVYLHSQHRVHRDLKCDNILMNLNGEVKIADLGIAAELDDDNEDSGGIVGLCGSKFWMAPEMIKHQPYNYKADIWSFGCLLFELVERKHPYSGYHSMAAMFYTATRGADRLTPPVQWSAEFLDFFERALQPDPELRPSAQELQQHPFLKQVRESDAERAHAVATLRQALEHAFIAQQFENMGMW